MKTETRYEFLFGSKSMSSDLSTLLGVTPETRMSRVEITKRVQQYIADHHLQDRDLNIVVDDALGLVFKKKPGEIVKSYNLESLLCPHILKLV